MPDFSFIPNAAAYQESRSVAPSPGILATTMSEPMAGAPPNDDRSQLERALSVVTEVRAGEGPTALLLTLNVFLILTAYYVLKPVREGLILAMPSGAQYKSYLGAANAIALLFIVPLYGRAADRFPKNKLVVGVTLFFASNLAIFYALSKTSVESSLGVAFFVWISVFNMMIVAQFWAFANDLYSDEQGKRLFPLVGIGASLGGVVGAYMTKELAKPLGTYQLMLVSMVVLCASAALTRVTSQREQAHRAAMVDPAKGVKTAYRDKPPEAKKADDGSGTFALVFRHKYLILIAVFSTVFTLVNTNGEYMLGAIVSENAKALGDRKAAQDFTTAFYGDFFLYVNILVVILQTFVVSRLVKFGGLRLAFFVLPVIALVDATGIALAPILGIVRIGKIFENATDYSVNNTTRNMLWLPTTTEMKYKAKQAVDTFFVRAGDVGSAGFVSLFAGVMGLGVRAFAVCNLVLVVVWLLLARAIVAENGRMHEKRDFETSG
jgi:AAA family ATP:ADP antiporter